ncbi:MAG: NADH:ubiquinone reductase (Na(+)-transporting) subunit C [Saprospiraceae bacterium]|nr:NADH:ubiquinone reductase (Na(+)-transporting) subunit C [Saprospiraceae bacterium]MCF8251673.1 NADH:ubiquinone reductase (Na(+)-transporting) subunit C [Saprospiraceae bacterium]MCF8283029.1 NADH:ubiquinone reductase (Na(+)-transporting) subunit C [Bacteroidales bacterium]MCF8311262.1 NADH:ubiquinone reductase (Na(+)-transporting) subunit C [Saprospiraceae bacterium]MCF8442036.1 NADH:ubiquinone reductase (Na(+)-transporting) subunit C [Saprospiraceae bacterium]
MHSNNYVTIYTVIMTLIVSVVLAVIVSGLKPIHDDNEAVFKKREIFQAVKDYLGADLDKMSDKEVLALFDKNMQQVVIDANGKPVEGVKAENIDMAKEEKKPIADRQYPVFTFVGEKGTYYLVSIRGNGLWDKIWSTIAFQDDFNTIAGVSFGHAAETPGLGAEITDNPSFPKQFQGKTIQDDGQYVSVAVVKGGIKKPSHQVDAITGATITSNGVTEMLERGLKVYLPYFESLKK